MDGPSYEEAQTSGAIYYFEYPGKPYPGVGRFFFTLQR